MDRFSSALLAYPCLVLSLVLFNFSYLCPAPVPCLFVLLLDLSFLIFAHQISKTFG